MKHFVSLFHQIDQTTKTLPKIAALTEYFKSASDEDKVWTIALFSHRRPKRTVSTTLLRSWCAEVSGMPLWLFEESYHIVGDLAETIALILPDGTERSDQTLDYWIRYNMDLKEATEEEKKEAILAAWSVLSKDERFLYNKLITGGFRVGVSQKTIIKALSKATEIDENKVTHRLMGNWDPATTSYEDLLFTIDPTEDQSRPYPFYLAYALDVDPPELGQPAEWQAERKWDGIRGQLILRGGNHYLWSRGEELVTDKFPELKSIADKATTDVVIDGEILPYKDGIPMSFSVLQTRIGRKNVTKKHLEEAPVHIMAYDLLEYDGEDIRHKSMAERRALLEQTVLRINDDRLLLSPIVDFDEWSVLEAERDLSREHRSEGIMLKRQNAPYQSGRKRGDWWKWKVDPMTVDAVMLYAQRGHGRRATLYTDFTFAVWDGTNLVPFAKAYSGLTDKEFGEVTKWVKSNTKERFGPVCSVVPELVFELAFEGIAKSTRHKSGIALRFPRIKRWRRDKPASEADTLANLQALLLQAP